MKGTSQMPDRERADRVDSGEPGDLFWSVADTFLARDDVAEGTLMGFPCLRVDGDFFATCEHRTGELIVKLSEKRVRELRASGEGAAFAPAGRVFKEWVLVSESDESRWTALLQEAYVFVKQA
jgi:hypothetical protein